MAIWVRNGRELPAPGLATRFLRAGECDNSRRRTCAYGRGVPSRQRTAEGAIRKRIISTTRNIHPLASREHTELGSSPPRTRRRANRPRHLRARRPSYRNRNPGSRSSLAKWHMDCAQLPAIAILSSSILLRNNSGAAGTSRSRDSRDNLVADSGVVGVCRVDCMSLGVPIFFPAIGARVDKCVPIFTNVIACLPV